MIDEIMMEAEEKMEQALDSLHHEFSRVRTGRANPAMLDVVRVDYYGAMTPLNQLANVSTPEANQLLVKPYDKSIIKDVERAINAANLGVNPNNEGDQIRIVLPALNEERRKELIKQVKKMAEDAKVKIRNARRDAKDDIKKLEKNGDISEDESNGQLEDLQELTDKYVGKVDESLGNKEKDLLEV
ncbi:MAG: ribosome recycling factor [Bacillota bacterium]